MNEKEPNRFFVGLINGFGISLIFWALVLPTVWRWLR